MDEYKTLKLKAGRDIYGNQIHRKLDVRTSEISYVLDRIVETRKIWDEEEERWRTEKFERRPKLNVTTKVVCSRNRFGIIRLYGTQGGV